MPDAQTDAGAHPAPEAPSRMPGTGNRVMYQGPGEDGKHELMRAVVLKVHDATTVDLHLFNGRLLGGTTLEDGRYVPAFERERVKHLGHDARGDGAEGWFWPTE